MSDKTPWYRRLFSRRPAGAVPPVIAEDLTERSMTPGDLAAIVSGNAGIQTTDAAGYAYAPRQLRAITLGPWVYKAVDMIATSVASTPLNVRRRQADLPQGETLGAHPLIDLLERPNPFQTATEFKKSIGAYRVSTGNAFVYVVRDGRGLPVELWPIRPDRVTIEPDAVNFIRGYTVRAGSTEQFFTPDEIIHWKDWNPYNDYWGLSPIQALAYTIEGEAGARRYNDSFYRNNARVSGALVSDNVLSASEMARLKNLWETEYKGAANAFKMAFLFGGLKYQQFGLSQADMQIIEALKSSKEDVLGAFGVPLGLVSENATEANAVVAYNTYATWTIYPLITALGEVLTKELCWPYGPDIYIEADDVRPQDKAGKLSLLTALQNGTVGPDGTRWPVLTVNEIRRDWLDAAPLEEIDPSMQFPEVEEEETPAAADEAPPAEGDAEEPPAQTPVEEADEEPARQRALKRDMAAELQLIYWKGQALNGLQDGRPREEWTPADTQPLDPLTRQVIIDLLAGAETDEDIHAAFREGVGDGSTYP